MKQKMTYTDAVREIEEILRQIEEGEPDVDQLTEKVKRVTTLIKFCKAKLKSAEEEINAILGEEDEDEE
jgi:exodeoxyribonuclease VII small subunit